MDLLGVDGLVDAGCVKLLHTLFHCAVNVKFTQHYTLTLVGLFGNFFGVVK